MESVKLAVGEYPRFFVWPVFAATTPPTYVVGSVLNSYPLPRELVYQSFLAWLVAGTTTPAVTIQLQGTNDPVTGQGFTIPCTLASSTTISLQTTGAATGLPTPWIGQQFAGAGYAAGVPYINTLAAGMIVLPAMTAPGANVASGTTVSSITSTTIVVNNAVGNTGNFQLSFYNNNWISVGTAFTTTAGSAPSAAAGLIDATSAYRWLRAQLTTITGTGTQALVAMCG